MSQTVTMQNQSFENAPTSDENGMGNLLPARNWRWFLARGLLLTALGIVALLLPGPAMLAFATVFAAFCLVNGVMSIASGVQGARNQAERWLPLILSGLAGIVVGVLFILFPMISTWAFALTTITLTAAWAVVTGGLEIAAAIRLRKEIKGEWLLALSGLLTVLVGLALAILTALLPLVSVLSVGWMLAVYAIVAGVTLTALALRLRTPAERPQDIALGGASPA